MIWLKKSVVNRRVKLSKRDAFGTDEDTAS